MTGRDMVAGMVDDWTQAFPDLSFDVQEMRDVGDHVIASVVLHGRGGASGVEVHEPYVFVYAMRDGLVAEAWEFRCTSARVLAR
jgi:ketosteroid isomerase-like protein